MQTNNFIGIQAAQIVVKEILQYIFPYKEKTQNNISFFKKIYIYNANDDTIIVYPWQYQIKIK